MNLLCKIKQMIHQKHKISFLNGVFDTQTRSFTNCIVEGYNTNICYKKFDEPEGDDDVLVYELLQILRRIFPEHKIYHEFMSFC